MYWAILEIINILRNLDDINMGYEVILFAVKLAEVALALYSISLCKKYYNFKAEKSWRLVAIIFGGVGAIGCYINAKQRLKTLPKTCNQCGTVTQNQYNVCKKCLAKDDFSYPGLAPIIVDNTKKTPTLITAIVAVVLMFVLFVLESFVLV